MCKPVSKPQRSRGAGRFWKVLVAALVAAVLPVGAGADTATGGSLTKSGALAGKRILLVNDDSMQSRQPDGSDGRGMYLLRKKLCRAGADVVIIAPWAQQSGRSRASSGAHTVRATAPVRQPRGFAGDCGTAPSRGAVLGVCQGDAACTPVSASVTPADAVDLALTALLRDRLGWARPDIVLSGINAGANTDAAVNLSGTVGAATAAAEHGVPAIAISAGTRATSVPTAATYQASARYVTGLAARLFGSRSAGGFAERRVIINVNHPDVRTEDVRPPARLTWVGAVARDRFTYTTNDRGTYDVDYGPVQPRPAFAPDSDTAALTNGRISVSAVSTDRTAAGELTSKLAHFVRDR